MFRDRWEFMRLERSKWEEVECLTCGKTFSVKYSLRTGEEGRVLFSIGHIFSDGPRCGGCIEKMIEGIEYE
jgi:hypothetical protein